MAANFGEAGADLELIGVTKRFPGFTAVDDLNLTIPGWVVLRAARPLGLRQDDHAPAGRRARGADRGSGADRRQGRHQHEAAPAAREHRVPGYALFPHMTGARECGVRPAPTGVSDARVRALEVLRLVELENLATRRPKRSPVVSSSGSPWRAPSSTVRPCCCSTSRWAPSTSSCAASRCSSSLKNIQHDVGLTFLHVTHDQEEAMTMADTVAVMNKGRIEQMGAPEELDELPTTIFVANFLGQSNLFTGEVITSGSTSIVVDIAGRKIEVPSERAQRHAGEVTIGVRPEKLTLHTSEPTVTPGINLIGPGRVNDVSFSGVSTHTRSASRAGQPRAVRAEHHVRTGRERRRRGLADLEDRARVRTRRRAGRATASTPTTTPVRSRRSSESASKPSRGGLMAFGAFAGTGPIENASDGGAEELRRPVPLAARGGLSRR